MPTQRACHPKSVSRADIPWRRARYFFGTAILVALAIVVCRWLDSQLVNASYLSGQFLAGLVLSLAAFRVRKRLPQIAWLGNASSWMQIHAWSGIAALVMFGTHVGWKFPNGVFEQLLAVIFLLTGGSGIYGLIMTRVVPGRLTQLRQQVIYEQIPSLRTELALRANHLIQQCPGTTLARHYVNSVAGFLHLPRSYRFVFFPSLRESKSVVSGIRSIDRYLSTPERTASGELMQIVREKDDLDYHRAMQGRLKWWIVVHLTLTGMLLILAALHVLLVYTFAGGGS